MKLIIFLLIALLTIGCYQKEQQNIDVNFCPIDNCQQVLINELQSASTSVDCAFYSIGKNTTAAFEALSVEKRLVLDKSSKINASFIKKSTGSGLMHNKFCIIDHNVVITGSYNPTDANIDHNAMLIIESKQLVKNYEAEFEELWRGINGKGNKTVNRELEINNVLVENYFCPENIKTQPLSYINSF
jgi:phosphatidylserine/phosphatidylglycerophosphate/cardiolipin synthase-like enzyme